ncbi:response regulator [Burkholderia vietnamiensis]|jgi:hypothetical protein|uniref:response regulator n=1 Tax=Burkholderia vietnamiensis TaxID=60552 RepID=UPI00104128BB|nr:response regulator [Burkholderia vietnamiensis]MBR8284936.1 response regulator [Burkholderia vietnamiensis]MCA8199252.1 response regulator [Burkholderia vietnamiensis]WHU93145.1 response regulator [Burkholderia vietnamiensis]HDR9031283.1 response regulator [Burkholderia vietnamiensis]HEF4840699.1 response regulator [Burkholderia vietnamiensis]
MNSSGEAPAGQSGGVSGEDDGRGGRGRLTVYFVYRSPNFCAARDRIPVRGAGLLRESGHDVVIAYDGTTCFNVILNFHPHVAVLDIDYLA